MAVVYIGLGSNLGSSKNTLSLAQSHLHALDGINVQSCSSFYRSKPLDNKPQPDYINAVVCLECDFSPLELLDILQAAEKHFGRTISPVRWDSRTLDLDILLYDDLQISNERLEIPHKGILERDFVLYPLFEIAPMIEIPGFGPISEAISACENRGLEKLNENDCKS